ncbi:MAG: hypothetical protein HQK99_02490 [Nitrospirae bacterium]|nr:hypothetical protein [Nitrospirota bacterium]
MLTTTKDTFRLFFASRRCTGLLLAILMVFLFFTAHSAEAHWTVDVCKTGTGTGSVAAVANNGDGSGYTSCTKCTSCCAGNTASAYCFQYSGSSNQTDVTLTETPGGSSTFGVWTACTGTGKCDVSGNNSSCTWNGCSGSGTTCHNVYSNNGTYCISVNFTSGATTTTAVSSTTTTAPVSSSTTTTAVSTTTSTTSTTTTTVAAVNSAMNNYCQGTSIPPFMGSSVPPLLMLDISKDHKNSYKAYSDYADLNGDGTVETQYKGTITYYGYFDPTKCYAYSSSTSTYTAAAYLFTPSSVSSTSPATCDGTKWSGNFLNWATMSRMDVLRKVLYGGYRSTDNSSMTILERQFLPQDAHSWAKVYTPGSGDPTINQVTPLANTSSISICNTTVADTANPPAMRVASGAWPYWASNERWQCARAGEYNNGSQWESRRPPSATGGYMDYIVRVQVCVPSLLGTERCQLYPSGNYKPIGLLQAYGESQKIYFGLMTGSWLLNKSGGVLRKNIGPFTDETNYTTDGTFCVNSHGTSNTACVSSTGVPGIIDTLNKIKIYRYTYGSGWSDGTYNTADACSWGNQSFTEASSGTCVNWGNPMAGMYYESLRYFMGLPSSASPGPTSAYDPQTTYGVNDSSIVSGLSTVTWKDPYSTYPYCSKPFIMVVSDISPSFDSDQMPGVNSNFGSAFTTDIKTGGTFLNVSTQTDVVGGSSGENVSGNYFIGQSGSTGDTQGGVATNLCTSKSVTSLSSLRGLCPTGPNFQGSYYMAGLAYWAHITDLRSTGNTPSNAASASDNITQNVTTYAVAMNTDLPNLSIKLGTTNQYTVQFIPACYNSTVGNPCTLVSFIVDDNFAICNNPPAGANGSYFITWEDSPQGGDYDMDADGCIYYTKNNAVNPPTISFKVNMTGSSTPYNMNMGYIVSGTTTDGPRYLATNCDSSSVSPNTGLLTSSACGGFFTTVPVSSGTVPTNSANIGSYTHTVSTTASTTKLLNDPLWYAAKWGGFTDINGNNLPDNQTEWSTGVNGTGVPDNYFLVTNPSTLETQMETAFLRILKQTSSGTAATVLSQRTQAGANILQVLFYPNKYFTGNTELSWVGFLNNLWFYNTSAVQEIREDTVNDFKLNLTNDNVIQFSVVNNNPIIQLYSDTTGAGTLTALSPATETFDSLSTIWEAGGNSRDSSSLTSVSTSYTGNYYDLYHDNATSRTIYTNGNTGLIAFNTANLSHFATYMGTTMVAGVDNSSIVNYIRGVDKSGLRNRTTAHLNSASSNVWKLGDIVYSTPLLNLYSPTTGNGNADYWVAFVGANDGMLHAFKAGKLSTSGLGAGEIEKLSGTALGGELWGFIPRNALPYLRYIADPSYSPNSNCHIYFNDLKPYIYAYTPTGASAQKVVLIGGMRLGGACGCGTGTCPAATDVYNPPTDTCSTANRTDATSPMSACVGLSSYYALDISNPTSPSLIWEFSHPELGFSYSGPAVINNGGNLMVMFLSGPQTYSGRSYQNLKTFVLSLNNDFTINSTATGSSGGVYKYDTGIARAYGGRLFTNGLDVNGDGTTDYVLFGYTSATDTSWGKVTGGIVSAYTGGTNPSTMCTGTPCTTAWSNCWNYNTSYFSLAGPITSKVEVDKCFSQYYVFAGTGKYFTALDNYTVVNGSGTTLSGDFLYSSPFPCDQTGCCTTVTHQSTSTVSNACNTLSAGSPRPDWTFPLDSSETVSGISYLGERNISDPTFASNMIFYTSTQPTSDVCSFGGRSRELVFNCATAAAPGGTMDNCTTYTIPATALQGSLFVQTSTSAINKISVKTGFHAVTASDSNQSSVQAAGGSMGAATSWMPGISPESATPYVAPSSASYGKILNWMER